MRRGAPASAARFAAAFYDALAEVPASEALARAQRALLATPETRNPFNWASYVLNGVGP